MDAWTTKNFRGKATMSDFLKVIDRSGVSFFFTNYPKDWTRQSMWIHFQRFGNVLDIFIPNKRSKQGTKFGFVKFKEVNNMEDLLVKIKSVAVGANYLLVNEARFRRVVNKQPTGHDCEALPTSFGADGHDKGRGDSSNNPRIFSNNAWSLRTLWRT